MEEKITDKKEPKIISLGKLSRLDLNHDPNLNIMHEQYLGIYSNRHDAIEHVTSQINEFYDNLEYWLKVNEYTPNELMRELEECIRAGNMYKANKVSNILLKAGNEMAKEKHSEHY